MTIFSITVLSSRDELILGESQSYVIREVPASNTDVDVYLNGLLMTQDHDYTRTGTNLLFIGQEITEGDTIRVKYWVAA